MTPSADDLIVRLESGEDPGALADSLGLDQADGLVLLPGWAAASCFASADRADAYYPDAKSAGEAIGRYAADHPGAATIAAWRIGVYTRIVAELAESQLTVERRG